MGMGGTIPIDPFIPSSCNPSLVFAAASNKIDMNMPCDPFLSRRAYSHFLGFQLLPLLSLWGILGVCGGILCVIGIRVAAVGFAAILGI